LTVKTVEHVCIGFPKDTTVLVDLNRLDGIGNPTVEVYGAAGWQFTDPINLSIITEDKEYRLLLRVSETLVLNGVRRS
jgi:hypothetical protein